MSKVIEAIEAWCAAGINASVAVSVLAQGHEQIDAGEDVLIKMAAAQKSMNSFLLGIKDKIEKEAACQKSH